MMLIVRIKIVLGHDLNHFFKQGGRYFMETYALFIFCLGIFFISMFGRGVLRRLNNPSTRSGYYLYA